MKQTYLTLLRGDLNTRESIDQYMAENGYSGLRFVQTLQPEEILQYLEESGLRGKGGAGFPAYIKWNTVRNAGKSVVVCNAAEGEEGLAKDKNLLSTRPHLVLEGMIIAATYLGATELIIGLKDTYELLKSELESAFNEFLQLQEFNHLHHLTLTVTLVPHNYVAGEETALLEALEGRPAKPRFKPPIPAEVGYKNGPTLIHNVESFSRVASLYREAGLGNPFRTQEIGSVMLTLEGAVENPGIYELPMGIPLSEVVYQYGVPIDDCFGIRIGGYFGKYFREEQIKDVRLSYDDLKDIGASIGCGTLTVFSSYEEAKKDFVNVTSFFAKESCGQCGPCIKGNGAMARVVEEWERSIEQGDIEVADQLKIYTSRLLNRGACGFLNGSVGLVNSFCKNVLYPVNQGGIVSESAY